ncbi:MAG: transposase [Cryobacterium sp.]|nr:transposase [Cryobacterium sp.]
MGAAPDELAAGLTTHRYGFHSRSPSTVTVFMELTILKLREGTFFPALLDRQLRVTGSHLPDSDTNEG